MNNALSKLGEWIGAFLLRSLLLIGAIVVFSNGIYMSWNHTHDFATIAGMKEQLATSYTMFVEVILGVSEIVIIFYSFLKTRIPRPVFWGFGFGLIINLIGNILSLINYGGWGVFAGVSITVGTIIASAIFASALVRQNEVNEQTDKTVPTTSDSSDNRTADTFRQSDSPLRIIRTKKQTVSGRTNRRYYFNGHLLKKSISDTSDSRENTVGHPRDLEMDTDHINTQTVEDISFQTLGQTRTDSTDCNVRTEETDIILDPDTSNKIELRTVPNTQTLEQADTQSDTLKTSDTPDTTIGQTENSQRTPRTKIANRINHLLDEEDTIEDIIDIDEHTYQTAIAYIKENKKRPSIRGLMDIAGVKKNRAEKAIKRIKEEQIV